jgi:hypothetical protein
MGDASKNAERPILNIEGNLVALDPLRWDLLPIYQRWINNLGTMRTLGLAPLPMTSEKEQSASPFGRARKLCRTARNSEIVRAATQRRLRATR